MLKNKILIKVISFFLLMTMLFSISHPILAVSGTGSWVGGHILPVTYVSDGFLANMQYAFIIGVDSTYCNGKECYVIKGTSYERYVDKETGLAVRNIEKSNKEITRQTDMIVDYDYKFNTVTDSDIVKPDTTGYITNE